MNQELITVLEGIRESIRIAQGVDSVDERTYSKLDELLYLLEDMLEDFNQ